MMQMQINFWQIGLWWVPAQNVVIRRVMETNVKAAVPPTTQQILYIQKVLLLARYLV